MSSAIKLESLSINRKHFKSRFHNVGIPLLNSLRSSLLTTETTWAFNTHIELEGSAYNVTNIDRETFGDMLCQIPVNGFAIYHIDVKCSKGNRIVTSNDLIPVEAIYLKSSAAVGEGLAPDAFISERLSHSLTIGMSETFKCILISRPNYEVTIQPIHNGTHINTDVLVSSLMDVVKKYVAQSKRSIQAMYIYKLAGVSDICCRCNNKQMVTRPDMIHKDIKLMDIAEGESVSMLTISEKGSPLDNVKWSAVSLASSYICEDDIVALDFSLTSEIYSAKEILKRAVESQKRQLDEILRVVEESEDSNIIDTDE